MTDKHAESVAQGRARPITDEWLEQYMMSRRIEGGLEERLVMALRAARRDLARRAAGSTGAAHAPRRHGFEPVSDHELATYLERNDDRSLGGTLEERLVLSLRADRARRHRAEVSIAPERAIVISFGVLSELMSTGRCEFSDCELVIDPDLRGRPAFVEFVRAGDAEVEQRDHEQSRPAGEASRTVVPDDVWYAELRCHLRGLPAITIELLVTDVVIGTYTREQAWQLGDGLLRQPLFSAGTPAV